jgi:hypothetical protein
LAILVLGGGVYGYWRFIYYPTTPQYALGEFLNGVRDRDYVRVYGRLHVTAPLKLVIPSAKALETVADNAGGLIPRLVSYRLGAVKRTEDGAVVEATLISQPAVGSSPSASGDVTDVSVEMRLVDDRWKVDAGWAMREMVKRGGTDLLRSLFQ